MSKRKIKVDRILKGDAIVMVLANADCETPLFEGRAKYSSNEPDFYCNEAEFGGTFFYDEGNFNFQKVPYEKYMGAGYTFRKFGTEGVAEERGYVWVLTVKPAGRFAPM